MTWWPLILRASGPLSSCVTVYKVNSSYKTSSHCCCAAICHLRPDSCAHRNWESRSPERLPSPSSSALVKGGNHVFGECRWWHDYSRHPLLLGGRTHHQVDRHCNIPTRHRAGWLHQQVLYMSTSATGSGAAGYNPKLFFPTRSYVIFLLVSLVYMTFIFRTRDENRSDTNGYHWYHICFHIFGRIRIRIPIISIMSDKIRLDVDIINIRFKYSDTDTV